MDLNGEPAAAADPVASPKSRSAGTSPAAVSNPPRMHSPRRVSTGASDQPQTPSKPPAEVTKSPRRLASPSKSPHNSPVAKVLPMEVVVNGSGDAAKKEDAKEEEEAMQTEEKSSKTEPEAAAAATPAPAEEKKPDNDAQKEEKAEKKGRLIYSQFNCLDLDPCA